MKNSIVNVHDLIEYNSNKVSMKKLLDTGRFNLALICLDVGQEIPPHPEGYDVVFYVVEGSGVFTVGVDEYMLEAGSMIFSPKEKLRGIRSLEKLSILGIRETV
jgi:quercetin dioxygenase-like cupin family protein